MARKVIQDSIIPARHGMAFEVKKGQVLRIYQVENKQVGDCVFVNAQDYKDQFHVGMTWTLNNAFGTGTAYAYTRFYSKPPKVNLMLTALEDTVKNHSGNIASRCSARSNQLRGQAGVDRSCDLNISEALAPYGLTADDVGDVFNVFMASELHADGTFTRVAPSAMKGDYVDLQAEMDLLVAISACPSPTVTNDYRPKPLGVKILQ